MRQERESKNLTRAQLAKLTGYTERSIQAWELGEWKPRPGVAEYILRCIKKARKRK